MRTLNSQYSKTHLLFKFPSLSLQDKKPNLFLHRKWLLNPKNRIPSSLTASCTANTEGFCNGWDELRTRVDSVELGESNQIKKFVTLLGFDDKKYVFTCMLGFVCALAISRVRVSSLVVFPAVVIVFAIGFAFGFVNGKPNKGLGLNGARRGKKDESLRVYGKKMKNLVEILDGFDVKVGELKGSITKAIDNEMVEVEDLEGYVDAVEKIGGLALSARNLVEECVEGQELDKNLIKNNNRKGKEIGNNGFDFGKFIAHFLGDNAGGSKSSKRNGVRKDGVMNEGVDNRDSLRGSAVERGFESVSSKDDGSPNSESSSDGTRKSKSDDIDQEALRFLQSEEINTMEGYLNSRTVFNVGGVNYQNRRFMDNRQVGLNMSAYREIRKWVSDDVMSGKKEFDPSKRWLESEAYSNHQKILQSFNGAYKSSVDGENSSHESCRASFTEETMNVEDELQSRKYQSQEPKGMGSFSSSMVAEDVLFDKCLTKANDLLKQAKEYLKDDEMLAEEMLTESANLLSQAIAMKPMSLLAIGQLGNTYLLHGELKLRISKELRRVLSKRNDEFAVERQNDLLYPADEALPDKDRIATLLVNVCEDCESLLVEAGKKYRTALAIDGNDLRALYNWGLALSFRAQLIADIGPEAALDADKLFMAAIDKFDGMMSRSNVYAPQALFKWGLALQQRSRLRPSNSKDKVKLLQQAKRLYEDAIDMGSDTLQVREALSSCISELEVRGIL